MIKKEKNQVQVMSVKPKIDETLWMWNVDVYRMKVT